MSSQNKLIQILFSPILWILYYISGLIPKNEKIEVYGSPGNRFSDNAKYAYLNSSIRNESKRMAYWITSDKSLLKNLRAEGLLAESRWSIKGVIVCCRAAKYHFSSYSSDVNFWTSRNSHHINYWHGVPFKKIEHDIHSGPLKTRFNPKSLKEKIHSIIWLIASPAPKKRPDSLYSPHSFFDNYFLSAFRVEKEILVRRAYPRVEYLNSTLNPKDIFSAPLPQELIELTKGKTAVLYTPTFRDSNKSAWTKENILPHAAKIQEVLSIKNLTLIIKPHPNEPIKSGKKTNNIYILDSKFDTYTLMRSVNHIVTDYSSIAVDAAQAGKNVYLFWPDLKEYTSKSRELYFNIEEFYNHKYYSNINELLSDVLNEKIKSKNVTPEINKIHITKMN